MAKQTPLYDVHCALNARIVDFSGWDMPVQYPTGILEEHRATREECGLFDTCHMGEFLIKADDVRAALNQCLAGDFTKLKPGRERYTFLTHDDGTVIDDAVVMLFSDTKAWIIVNAGDIEGDFDWVQSHLPEGAMATNLSADTGKLDVQGPDAWQTVKAVTGQDFRTMPFYSFIELEWNGVPLVLSRSGYTGEPGAELYVSADKTAELWTALLEAGPKVTPCGLGARDTLRLEAGLPLYGHEMNRQTNPIQAGFGRFVGLDKPQDFPGKAALTNSHAERVLVGLTVDDKRVPRPEFTVVRDDKEVGVITSGAPGPTVGCPLALAYVDTDCSEPGTALSIRIRKKDVPATVRELPFYKTPALRARMDG